MTTAAPDWRLEHSTVVYRRCTATPEHVALRYKDRGVSQRRDLAPLPALRRISRRLEALGLQRQQVRRHRGPCSDLLISDIAALCRSGGLLQQLQLLLG